MEDELLDTVAKSLGFASGQDFTKAMAFEGLKETGGNLATLFVIIKKYGLFTDLGVSRLEQVITEYFTIINDELDIEALRQAE